MSGGARWDELEWQDRSGQPAGTEEHNFSCYYIMIRIILTLLESRQLVHRLAHDRQTSITYITLLLLLLLLP